MKKKISACAPTRLSDFLNSYHKIEQEIEAGRFPDRRGIKVAFLADFTAKGIKEILFFKCFHLGLLPKFYLGGYNQCVQEILNPASELYRFSPDVVILFLDTQSLLGDLYYHPYQISEPQRREWATERLAEMKSLIQRIKEDSPAKVLLHNLQVPTHSPLGILENKQAFGFVESIQWLNEKLRNLYKEDTRVFLFDYDGFCSKIGKQSLKDPKMYYLGDMKLHWDHMPALCDAYLSYIKPLMSLAKKCIVLDLDNTLWGGVVGEDGFEKIQLGPTPEGKPFWEFQQVLLSLHERGVLLAINSRNNPDEALRMLREHPYRVLKEEHFASIQINWNDKAANLEAIARELNIGLDSLVFLDDDKIQRELVKNALPEVLVVDLPEDPALYLSTLLELNDLNTLQITDEDKTRGRDYAAQKKRDSFKRESDLNGYLKDLQMVATIARASSLTIPRIAQLTQKTNQFNMTTRRYLEEDIRGFAENPHYLVLSLHVADRFGDSGITGTMIVEILQDHWKIDSFLMSCRVIGRKIEEAFLGHLLNEARKHRVLKVSGEFIPTKKNLPAKDFYKNNGFRLMPPNSESEFWEYALQVDYLLPDCVQLVIRDLECKD